jgi:hypothetical protein
MNKQNKGENIINAIRCFNKGIPVQSTQLLSTMSGKEYILFGSMTQLTGG